MLHVKSCNLKHNSESVFRYFASAVNSDKSTKFCLIYSDWAFEITLRSSSARLDQPCAVQIHLIGVRDTPDNCSVRYRELSLYDFTL